jgi:hypothetical protein
MYKGYQPPVMYIPDHGWYPRAMGERIVAHLEKQASAAAVRGCPPTRTGYRRVDAP